VVGLIYCVVLHSERDQKDSLVAGYDEANSAVPSVDQVMRFEGKRVVIIGGSSGIGLETARLAMATAQMSRHHEWFDLSPETPGRGLNSNQDSLNAGPCGSRGQFDHPLCDGQDPAKQDHSATAEAFP
jgi:hypothetical protein